MSRSHRDGWGRSRTAALFAVFIAVLDWSALAVEGSRVLARALAAGRGIAEALFMYFRFFTILTNAGVAILMTATALAIWRGKEPLSAAYFRAAVVYMLVTCVTYELLLRHLWSPQGLQFATDLTFHDIEPALLLIYWVAFAPKRDMGWRDLPWLLAYPAVYFAVTLVAGLQGAGYPYDFLDAAKLGYPTVLAIGFAFLAVFLALGTVATMVGRAITDDRSAAA